MVSLNQRSFSYLDGPLFKELIIPFVRPRLEYGLLVWAPHLKKQINTFEDALRRATELTD